MVKAKGIMDFIKEDSFLSTPMTYEEFINSTQSGFDDSGIEEAFEAYQKIMKNSNVKPKGMMDYIAEDPSLSRKMTLEEFESHSFMAEGENDDVSVEEAFEGCQKVMAALG